MSTADRFWARRLRWRLIGAWRWPLFLVLTVVDALVVHWLPPNGTNAKFIPWLIISAFANLFLIGAIAPWLAKRMVARQGEQAPSPTFPPANHLELLTDRIASIVLVISTVGLLVAGAGNHKVVVAATDRLAAGAESAKAFVSVHAPPEIRRNIDALNSHELQQDGLFRMCVPYDDRLKAFCMYVDAGRKPPTVKPDGDSRPNGAIFGLNGPQLTGTLINIGAILAGTGLGLLLGHRLPPGMQERVMMGLGLLTLVLGIDNALQWRHTNPLIVFGAILLGGLLGEAIGIERRLGQLGDAIQAKVSRGGHSRVSEGFVTASLLFCIGPLTVVGSIQDGLTGDYQTLASKALLDGFASIAFAAALGWGVALAAGSVLVVQGAITLAAGLFENVLGEGSEALAALVSAGGILIIGISLKLLGVKDVKVGNFLPALVLAPVIVGIVSLFG